MLDVSTHDVLQVCLYLSDTQEVSYAKTPHFVSWGRGERGVPTPLPTTASHASRSPRSPIVFHACIELIDQRYAFVCIMKM